MLSSRARSYLLLVVLLVALAWPLVATKFRMAVTTDSAFYSSCMPLTVLGEVSSTLVP